MDFHKRLRRLRKDKNQSYQKIADACGVKWQTVQQWCKDESEGGTYPKIENLEPLARLFETTPWYLLWGVEAAGSIPSNEGKPVLSDEAEDLIKEILRIDGAGGIARKTFALHKGLLLLFPHKETSEYGEADRALLDEGEQIARDVLAREQKPEGRPNARATEHRDRHHELQTPAQQKRGRRT